MSSRTRKTGQAFTAITVEGALIAPAQIDQIAHMTAKEQKEADYGVKKGLNLRDELARFFRIGQALFAELKTGEAVTQGRTVRFVEALLKDVLEFPDVVRVGHRTLGGHDYPITLEAAGGRVPIVVVPPSDRLDGASDHLLSDGRRRSAASALQDWLNADDGATWGLATNGHVVRLLRDNASLTRPAYIEADLREMFENEAFADFSVFWLLVHASRFGAKPALPVDCPLERWREAGEKAGETARENLRAGVEEALQVLGTGFLSEPANDTLRQRVVSGQLQLPDFFGQLLRLVYRLIFLAVAEDRELLHPPGTSLETKRLYDEGYSLKALRARAVRRGAWDRHRDRWEGLCIIFTGLSRGEKLLGVPALGGLFAPHLLPDLSAAKLQNRALMEALYRINWLLRDGRAVPVNWRDMETEELGSVYEALLELTPKLLEDGRRFAFAEGTEARGHARKTSGSYYTPDSLVQALLDSALDPVLDRVEAEANDLAAALLGVTVIDPACGSGHFLLAAARRIATRLANRRAGGLASAEDYRHALRDVARACIHGVDRNPMAVELTKVALWIETVDPGKPLGFFDANIRCGDALLGVYDLEALRTGIPDAAYKPLTGDDKDTAKHFARRNQAEKSGQGLLDFAGASTLPSPPPMAGGAKRLRFLPEDTPEEVAARARTFAEQRNDPRLWRWKVASDLYVAAFVTPKTGGVPASAAISMIPTTGHVWQAIGGKQIYGPLQARALELAAVAGAFHWPLEFPDIMTAGGFDLVIGNPPWERIKLQEQEFFAARDIEIAQAPNAAARGRLIAALKDAPEGSPRRLLHDEFETSKRVAEASSVFARVPGDEKGRFPLAGRGDINTYALFAELFSVLVSPLGQSGVIVPTGIATDANTAPIFASLTNGHRLVSLIDFENRDGIFPSVHRSSKFSLLTLGHNVPEARFSFFLTDPRQLGNPEQHFALAPADIAMMNPNTRTAPVFRSRADAELTKKIYAHVPVLIDDSKGAAGNPWGITFARLFDMSNDSDLFRTAAQLAEAGFKRDGRDWIRSGARYTPLYEAKMCALYDHRAASYEGRGDDRGYRVLPETSAFDHNDPDFEVTPFYWAPEAEVNTRLQIFGLPEYLLGFNDISTPVTERSFIPTLIPRSAVGNSMPLIFVGGGASDYLYLIIANLSSLIFDYFARQKIGRLHFNFFIVKQLPVLPPSWYSRDDMDFFRSRVLELIYTSWSMLPFARDLGFDGPPFAWDEERRARIRAELDAKIARLYGLTKDELKYILDPADVRGHDYPSETFRVLRDGEMRSYRQYRTRDLVLEAWDRDDASLPIFIPMPVPVRLHPSGLSAGDWARPATAEMAEIRLQTRAQIAAVLKALAGPTPANQVRLATLYALEPHLLTSRLNGEERNQWVRAVGSAANPGPPEIPQIGLGGATGWGDALRQLAAGNALIEDSVHGTWAPGPGLSRYFTDGWPERAGFALEVAARVLGQGASALTQEETKGLAALAA